MALRTARATVTVSSGGTTSPAIACDGAYAGKVWTPSALTSTAMSFLVSDDDGTTYAAWVDDLDATTSSRTIAASQGKSLPEAMLRAATHFKIVLGSAEGADRALRINLVGDMR